jgi:hypothetical protein
VRPSRARDVEHGRSDGVIGGRRDDSALGLTCTGASCEANNQVPTTTRSAPSDRAAARPRPSATPAARTKVAGAFGRSTTSGARVKSNGAGAVAACLSALCDQHVGAGVVA